MYVWKRGRVGVLGGGESLLQFSHHHRTSLFSLSSLTLPPASIAATTCRMTMKSVRVCRGYEIGAYGGRESGIGAGSRHPRGGTCTKGATNCTYLSGGFTEESRHAAK